MSNPKRTEKPDDVAVTALLASAEHIQGKQAALALINQLLTRSEKVTLGRRILVANMLVAGNSRMEICGALNVSPNQVAKVRKWLAQQIPEYEKIHNNPLPSNFKSAKKSERIDPLSLSGLRQKYPLHFLFFNTAEVLLNELKK